MADEELEVAGTQFEVMLALSRVEGQLSAFIQLMTSQGDAITHLTTEQGAMRDRLIKVEAAQGETAGLRDRVVAIEASKTATPPWWIVVGALIPTLAFVWLIAEQIFGK